MPTSTPSGSGNRPLAHGWRLADEAGVPDEVVREFVRPAIRAVPTALAVRLGPCRIRLLRGADFASRWNQNDTLEIELATEDVEPHDLAIELLVCLGQALWESATHREREAYLKLLDAEIEAGVPGEIDEDALEQKRTALASPDTASLEQYAGASFAASLAEYVHCLWHDVTVRTGPEHLPPDWLHRRLRLFERWFPPDRGYRLFPGATTKR